MDKQILLKEDDKLILGVEAPVPFEYKLNRSIRKIRGHSMFAWNPTDGTVEEIQMKSTAQVRNDFKGVVNRFRVNQQENLYYIQALNIGNAKKKIRKIIKQAASSLKK